MKCVAETCFGFLSAVDLHTISASTTKRKYGDTTLQKPTSPQKTYLNSQEAADLLRLSIRTLERMRVEGTGPKFLKAGQGTRSRVLYRPADIEAWLDANAFHSTSQYVA